MKGRALWIVLLLCASGELAAHATIESRVPSDDDYHAAAQHVREAFQASDAISAAPDYIDPLMRRELGDLIPLSMIGRPDLAAYKRLWVLSVGKARAKDAPARAPQWQRRFGNLRLSRYELGEPTETLNLVSALEDATVTLGTGSTGRRCPWRRGRAERGGALGRGTIGTAARFVCGPGRDGMVAAVVVEDLNLGPRYCIWTPALARRKLSVRFSNVALEDQLVLDAGLYYEHERDERDPPVRLHVRVNGQHRATLVHKDGQGFVRQVVPTVPSPDSDLEFEVNSTRRHRPGFCWSGSIRKASP